MTPEQAFGMVLKEHREALKLSQEKLAFQAGLDRTFISMLERGIRQPSLTSILVLAEALNVSAEQMVKKTKAVMARQEKEEQEKK